MTECLLGFGIILFFGFIINYLLILKGNIWSQPNAKCQPKPSKNQNITLHNLCAPTA